MRQPKGGRRSKKAAKAGGGRVRAGPHKERGRRTSEHADRGVEVTSWGASRIHFTFYGVEFSFNPIWPLVGGFVIAAISAFIGVGGGFLYVPFLTSIAGLPMYVVAGTSALAVLVEHDNFDIHVHVRQGDSNRPAVHRHRACGHLLSVQLWDQ